MTPASLPVGPASCRVGCIGDALSGEPAMRGQPAALALSRKHFERDLSRGFPADRFTGSHIVYAHDTRNASHRGSNDVG